MAPAAEHLKGQLASVTFHAPRVPVVANVTGRPHGAPEQIRADMVRQVTGSVRWLDSIEWFKANGVSEYIELGPGKVLSGLIKRIDRDAGLHNIQDLPTLEKTVSALKK
jgi:[acyl-carrier-protein] S-malonyltransferase